MQLSAIIGVLLFLAVTTANASVCPKLKTAGNYVVIAGSAVTNTEYSVITGNLAVSPSAALTGFPTGVITGVKQLGNLVAAQAQTDATLAYYYCKTLLGSVSLTGINLAGKTLGPGVYNFGSTALVTVGGTLTLKGKGVYVFQVGSSITTAANTKILLSNGATAGCVFWQVGSSVTLGASSLFVGNILAYASVTFGADVIYHGSVYAQTGDVTLIGDTVIHQLGCTAC